ncbi:MAG: polymorphic toxin-type HINT domain-containing protein [Pirellulaceae bacterium]|nr:polymorphic toxin-type HINT domain-containing protein [Pirellulaceae bacterium]
MNSTNDLLKRIALGLFGLSLMAYGLWPRNEESTAATGTRTRNAASVGSGAKATTHPLVKVPIKDMRVGTRVPAFNPEVSATERAGFREPNWHQWMKLRLEMPKPDGTLLEIEMLRSEEWLVQQMAVVVQPESIMLPSYSEAELNAAEASVVSEPSSLGSPAIATANDTTATKTQTTETTFTEARSSEYSGIPLRPIYFHLAELLSEAAADGNEVLGLVVQLDLPELGLSGPAWIVDLESAPIIPPGPGQVVTATFKHASANVLDLILTSTPPTTSTTPPTSLSTRPTSLSAIIPSASPPIASSTTLSSPPIDTIGVTANHPFWSVDRAEFVQAGELTIGERLQTLAGDTVWVKQKLPRPGPEPVYNLEVHAEHVYYVGNGGVLAHNSQSYTRRPGGYRVGDTDAHGLMSPGANRASGYANTALDGRVQSHHGIQRAWAKRNIALYDEDAAPGLLMKSSSGEVHAKLSAAQRARRRQPGGWDTDIRSEFNISYRELVNAGLSIKEAQRVIKQNYKYFHSLGAFN